VNYKSAVLRVLLRHQSGSGQRAIEHFTNGVVIVYGAGCDAPDQVRVSDQTAARLLLEQAERPNCKVGWKIKLPHGGFLRVNGMGNEKQPAPRDDSPERHEPRAWLGGSNRNIRSLLEFRQKFGRGGSKGRPQSGLI
jgi:hypothetical protein